MAWTADDLTAVETAIRQKMTGQTVSQVSNSDKSLQYETTSLNELYALRSQIQIELGQIPVRAYAKNVRPPTR